MAVAQPAQYLAKERESLRGGEPALRLRLGVFAKISTATIFHHDVGHRLAFDHVEHFDDIWMGEGGEDL